MTCTPTFQNLIKIKSEQTSVIKGHTNLKICCINPRSVKNKTLSFCDYINSNDFDLVAVTETWLGTSIDKACISELLPSGYHFKHVPRSGDRRGGGVALIFRASIDLRIVASSHDNDFSSFEYMDCNVVINDYSLRIAVVYRPPPTKQNGVKTNVFLEQEWPQFLAKYATIDKNIIITGDLNFHLDIPSDRDTIKFNSVLQSCGMLQHVKEPTHVRGHTLDVVITRETDKILSCLDVSDPGLLDKSGKITRDHFAVVFSAHAAKPRPVRKTVSFRKLRAIDVDSFKQDIISSSVLSNSLNSANLEELVRAYTSELSALIEKHAPLRSKTITLRPSCVWYTQNLHDAKHLRRKLERTWRKSKLTIDHQIYRSQCANVNKMLKQAKIDYYSDKVSSCGNDQKSLHKITKHLLQGSTEASLPSGKPSNELAQGFSDFFIDKIQGIRNDIASQAGSGLDTFKFDSDKLSMDNCLVEFAPASEEEIKKVIKSSPDKSCELDPIPTWLLKSCLPELLPFLTKIINFSLETGYVPASYKSSLIRPLLKKPGLDQNMLKNYRPVSNLPFVSKVLEKVVSSRIEEHLISNNLHEQHQSAYRKFHSTETALLKVQNDILQSLDKNNVTVLVMLDLSAAFDTIDHKTLLHRLEDMFGIAGKPLEWMTSYLSGRYQTVTIDGKLSEPVLMNFSVPQGSVLGPKFYTMYTTPIGAICKKHRLKYHFYADDSQLYLSFEPTDQVTRDEAIRRVEACLKDILSWMQANMLKQNADKTEVIIFTSERNAGLVNGISVTVGDSNIKPSSCVRNLGAWLDSRMDMEQHVNSVCKSCFGQIRQIGHIRQYLTTDASKSLVNSLVTSRLDYCNALLSGVPKTILNKLQNVQNTAARVVTRTSRYCHITPILKELHWLPVQYRVQYKILTHTYKALHDRSPVYIKELLHVYRPRRELRSQNGPLILEVPRSRTVLYGDRSFAITAPKLWNALPPGVRACSSLCAFKKSLKTHLFIQMYGQ